MASRRIRRTSSFTGFLAATTQDLNTSIKRNDVTSISAGVIDGSHIAEEVQVIDKALQSGNYVPAESGWKIDGSGNAEFGNVYVRGDINAQTGTIGYWNISTPSVERTIGPARLFGTFLESQNLGASDDGASGTYVSLFKSYIQADSGLSAIARDADGNAVVTVVNHNYLVGDLVKVTVDDVAGFSTGDTPVEILSVDTDTFTYASPGSVVATTATTGTVVFVNPDVSGLYLKDYTKANFDYGYMSNTGMAYVSAETLNLVYNPSFEYTDLNTYDITAASGLSTTSARYTVNSTAASNPFVVDQRITVADVSPSYFNGTFFVTAIGGSSGAWTVTVVDASAPFTSGGSGTAFGSITSTTKPSVASWDTSAGGAVTSWSFISSTLKDYATASSYGGAVSWTNTTPTAKFRTTVDYTVGHSYKLFDGDRPLYFSYDAFLNYQPYSAPVSTFTVTSSSVLTITTGTPHGLTAGDIVYLDFTAIGFAFFGASGSTKDFTIDDTNFNSRLFEVLTVGSTTSFTIENKVAGTAPSGVAIASRVNRDGVTSRAQNVYKVIWPAIDLSETLFVFPNASTASLYSVLDVDTKAAWDADAYYKYRTINPNDWMLEYLDPVDGIGPLLANDIVIDGSALRDSYSTNDSAGFLAKSTIKLQIPVRIYAQTYANGDAGTYTSSTGAITTSKASVTAISYGGGYITYTAANNFVTGDYVTVTGATSSQYNVTNERIYNATSTAFTVNKTVTAGTTSTASATTYKVVSTVVDQVSISTESVAFYGDTSDSYYWKDSTLGSPSQVSILGPKKWIDIDLSTQTGTLSNLDYVGFKSSHIRHPMYSKPNISTVLDSASGSAYDFDIYDYEQIKTSSGIFQKANIDDTGVVSFEAYSKSLTSDVASLSEIASTAHSSSARVVTYSEYSNSRVVLTADAIHAEGSLLVSDIYPGNSLGYHVDPSVTGGTIALYGDYVSVGTTSATGTSLLVYGNANFYQDASVTGVTYLGEVEATGAIQVNTTTAAYVSADSTQTGAWLNSNNDGLYGFARDGGIVLYIKRQTNDGTLVSLNSQGTQQGSISISGTTVSYNTFLGSHYSEMSEDVPVKGTIVESINTLVDQRYSDQERMPKVKVSDTAGSKKVYGVYLGVDYDDNDQESGHLIAAVGAGWVRIASGVTVEAGDLIESNGDGCGRVQADDIIRSSTVCKITSNVVINTYEDGSYLVPCVLYCG